MTTSTISPVPPAPTSGLADLLAERYGDGHVLDAVDNDVVRHILNHRSAVSYTHLTLPTILLV